MGLESEIIELRKPVLKAMMGVRNAARKVLDTQRVARKTGALEYVVANLIGGSRDTCEHAEAAGRYIESLTAIIETPFVLDLSDFAEKSELDWPPPPRYSLVIDAVLGRKGLGRRMNGNGREFPTAWFLDLGDDPNPTSHELDRDEV